MDLSFNQPYASQGLTVVALDADNVDALNVPGLEEYVSYLNVGYATGVETDTTYDELAAAYQGSNPFPLDVVVNRDQTIAYLSREYDAIALDEAIQEALAAP